MAKNTGSWQNTQHYFSGDCEIEKLGKEENSPGDTHEQKSTNWVCTYEDYDHDKSLKTTNIKFEYFTEELNSKVDPADRLRYSRLLNKEIGVKVQRPPNLTHMCITHQNLD